MRHFPDFLTAYVDYARNEYAPEHFTLWTGLSVLAGAVERKVWIQEGGGYKNYPNLFIVLVAGPGIGKSSAIRQGMPLLYAIKDTNPNLKIHEGVITSAALRKEMILCDTMPGGGEPFSSIFLCGREGSESPLKNHGDDFRSAACQMYDCEDCYQFSTAKDGKISIKNPVMNMIVGATFDFLGSVVDQNTVFGGLASRFTYVIEKDDKMKGDFFALDAAEAEAESGSAEVKAKLIHDLREIHNLCGKLRIERSVVKLCEEWFSSFKEEFNSMESARMKAINIRKRTLLKKLLILSSVSHNSSMIVTEADAVRAIDLVTEVTKDNPYIMSQAAVTQIDTQHGVTQLVIQTLKRHGGKSSKKNIYSAMISKGNDLSVFDTTINALIAAGWIKLDISSGIVELLIDPDRYL